MYLVCAHADVTIRGACTLEVCRQASAIGCVHKWGGACRSSCEVLIGVLLFTSVLKVHLHGDILEYGLLMGCLKAVNAHVDLGVCLKTCVVECVCVCVGVCV